MLGWMALLSIVAVAVAIAGCSMQYGHADTDPQAKPSPDVVGDLSYLGGYTFEAESYTSPDLAAQGIVNEIVRLYGEVGNAAFTFINAVGFEGTHYPFVFDAETLVVVAEGAYPVVVGLPAVFLHDVDLPMEQILADLEESEGVWVEYPFTNPQIGTEQLKRSWLSQYDGYIFGVGYHPMGAGAAVAPGPQSVVAEAIRLYESDGEEMFEVINAEAFEDLGRLTVYEIYTGEVVADGAFPDRVGQRLDAFFQEVPGDIVPETVTGMSGVWTEYVDSDPETGESWRMLIWSVLHEDGYVFQAGYAYSPEAEVVRAVEDAISLYDLDPETAFDRITWQAVKVDLIYPFVISGNDYSTLAHAAIPDFVGTCCSDAIRFTGDRPFEVVLDDLRRDEGTWVE